jgi:GH25 family lysozyme M1 (1,4-beta-N-acetylmuramidase)
MNAIGIGDASEYDTNQYTDWSLARRHGCEFGIVRASTTGAWINGKPEIRQDKMFAANCERMQKAGIKRMSYHWFDPRWKVCQPVVQANFFMDTLNKYGGPGELGPMLDLEDAGSAGIYAFNGVGQYIKQWLDAVEYLLKVKPAIYTNLSYVNAYLFNYYTKEDWLIDYPLIIANWGVTAPWVPQPWAPGQWQAWQYRADAPGKYYGFHNPYGPQYQAPNICLAVWNGQL